MGLNQCLVVSREPGKLAFNKALCWKEMARLLTAALGGEQPHTPSATKGKTGLLWTRASDLQTQDSQNPLSSLLSPNLLL